MPSVGLVPHWSAVILIKAQVVLEVLVPHLAAGHVRVRAKVLELVLVRLLLRMCWLAVCPAKPAAGKSVWAGFGPATKRFAMPDSN